MRDSTYRQMVQEIAEQPCAYGDASNKAISCADDPRVVKLCWSCRARSYLAGIPAMPPGWCCYACGTRHNTPTKWPFVCDLCHTAHYCSPKPVVACIVPAWSATEASKKGIVVIRRGIEPRKGELAFPGGYIDFKEDWRVAAAREFHEELGVSLDPHHFHLRGDPVTTPSNFLVLFAQYSGEVLNEADFRPSPTEVQEVLVLDATDQKLTQLGVPAHNVVWQKLHLL